GERVAAGELIVRLADRDYRAELRAVEAQSDETQARLKMLRAGPRAEELRLARQNIETAETRREHALRRYEEAEQMQAARLTTAVADLATAHERLRYARNDLERFHALFAAQLIARRTLEEAQEQTGVREKELTAAKAEVDTVAVGDLASTGDLAGVRKEMAGA